MMRPLTMRAVRPIAAAGALLTVTTTAVAAAPATSASDSKGAVVSMSLRDRHLSYGERLVVSGRIPDTAAGRDLVLEFRPLRGEWRAVKRLHADTHGRYRAVVKPIRNGQVRVRRLSSAAAGAVATPKAGSAQASPTRRIAVAASLSTRSRSLDVKSGHVASVSGRLRPGYGGRLVRLQARHGHHWRTIARSRTGRSGRYVVHYRARRTGSLRVRVHFGGDRRNGSASRSAGHLNVYRPALASWYGAGGAVACAGMSGVSHGVANKSMPCGTRLTIKYHGRKVRAMVTDRGPYVGGREFDLNGNVARALGFDGVGTVWVTR